MFWITTLCTLVELFYCEDGNSIYLRNVDTDVPDRTIYNPEVCNVNLTYLQKLKFDVSYLVGISCCENISKPVTAVI
jgi:hypothetical protein